MKKAIFFALLLCALAAFAVAEDAELTATEKKEVESKVSNDLVGVEKEEQDLAKEDLDNIAPEPVEKLEKTSRASRNCRSCYYRYRYCLAYCARRCKTRSCRYYCYRRCYYYYYACRRRYC